MSNNKIIKSGIIDTAVVEVAQAKEQVIVINEIVGNDNGNSEHDLIINGEEIAQPNIISKVTKLPLLDDINIEYTIKNLHSQLIVTVNSPSALPGIYYCGEYALKSGQRIHNIEVGSDNDKASTDIVVINTLAQIAAFAVKKAYESNPKLDNQIVAKVDMTTALPVTQYCKELSDKLINKFLVGKHNVIVHVGVLRADVDITFEFGKVLPEGVTTIHALQSYMNTKKEKTSEDETERNKEVKRLFGEFNRTYGLDIDGNYFKKKKILHVAIGEGTTEVPITDDVKFDTNFINGDNYGVGHAIKNALSDFKKKTTLRTFTRQNFSALLRDPEHKNYNKAMDCVEPYLESESEDILGLVKDELEKANNDVDIICVYGGGSILMKEYLQKKLYALGENTDVKIFYVPAEFAVKLEAVGMYEFTKGKIYKALKDMYLKGKTV